MEKQEPFESRPGQEHEPITERALKAESGVLQHFENKRLGTITALLMAVSTGACTVHSAGGSRTTIGNYSTLDWHDNSGSNGPLNLNPDAYCATIDAELDKPAIDSFKGKEEKPEGKVEMYGIDISDTDRRKTVTVTLPNGTTLTSRCDTF